MKKIKFLAAFVAFATLLGLTGCSDDQTELLNGGQGPASTIILNVNYTIPGDSTRVFYATYVSAAASGDNITITAENDETGESLIMAFGNQLNKNGSFEDATMTYISAAGQEYTGYSPITGKNSGVVKLKASADGSLTGAFSMAGFVAGSDDVVPFFSGIFENVPLTGDLPEPIPYISMKAFVDNTAVIFRNTSTIKEGAKVTFKGISADPAYEVNLIFADTASVEIGTFAIDTENVSATVKAGDVTYTGVSGSIKINTISDNVATGTFYIYAEKVTETGTTDINVSEGKFTVDFVTE